MTNRSRVYTKTGDNGTTSLTGGARIGKDHLCLDACGTIDELNSWIGVIRSYPLETSMRNFLIEIQNKLFVIGAKLASGENGKTVPDNLKITGDDTGMLEKAIDGYDSALPELRNFILPGGIPVSGFCHVARAVCRRAERKIVLLAKTEPVDPEILRYINRLSDFLFVLSRKIASDRDAEEIAWEP